MSLSRKQIRKLILEEIERISEMEELAGAKSGKAIIAEGKRIMAAGKKIYEIGCGQTGTARRTIGNVGNFIHKLGSSIATINELSEGDTVSKMPSVREYKAILKEISKLEKI